MNPNFSNINKSTENDEKVKYLLLELNNFVERFRQVFNTNEIDGKIESLKNKIGNEFFSNTCNNNTCNNINTDSFLSNYIMERPLPDADGSFISFGKWNDIIREVVRGVNHSYDNILNKREIPINVTRPRMRGDQRTLREELQKCIVDGYKTTRNRY